MNEGSRWRKWLRRGLAAAGILLGLLLLALAARSFWAFRDRNPGYQVDLHLPAPGAAAAAQPLRAGFARQRINPDLSRPGHPVWIAGFSQHRAATAIHDDLWAVGCVWDDGVTKVGLVVLDAIGFFQDDVIAVRRAAAAAKLQYMVVCSTHNHSTPDLMGLWGPHPLKTGVDPDYRQQVIQTAAKVLVEAASATRPARMGVVELPLPTAGLVADTRKPEVFDATLRAMVFRDAESGAVLGSVVNWGDHPETPWSRNTEITSDYCGYLRDELEKGIAVDGQVREAGLGGIHLFVNGAVGGLMSTTPSVTVRDPYLDKDFKEPSHDKARAVARRLGQPLLPLLRKPDLAAVERAPITVDAATLEIPLANKGFFAAAILGLMDRGHSRLGWLRTEVAVIGLGDVRLICVPGELYPELANGGIERAPGGDFDCNPVEVPALRQLVAGKPAFLLGLANDEIGYIIPKSEWDQKPPYLYGAKHGVYGEVNSVGPETAPRLHRAIKVLVERMGSVKEVGISTHQ